MQVHRCQFVPWQPQGILCMRANGSRTSVLLTRDDGTIELWNKSPSFSLVKVIPAFSITPEAVRRCVWQGDEVFYTAGWGKEIHQWSVHSLLPTATSSSFGGAVWDLSISSDGRTLVAACEDGSLRVFDVTDGALTYSRSLSSSDARVLCCAFHPQRNQVALGDVRGRMEVWDLDSNAQICRVKVSGGSVEAAVEAVCFADDGTVVTGDFIGYTQFWDVATQTLLHSFRSHTACIQTIVTAPGPVVFVSGMDPKVVRFVTINKTQWTPSLSSFSHEHPVRSLDYCGATLISASADGSLRLYGMLSFSTKPATPILPYVSCRPSVSLAHTARVLCCRLPHSVQLWRLGKVGKGRQGRTTAASAPERLPLAKQHTALLEIVPNVKLPLDFAEISHNGELVMLGTREGIRAYTVEEDGGVKGVVGVSPKELPDELADLPAVALAISSTGDWLAVADYHGVIHTFALPEFAPRVRITAHRSRYVSRLCVRGALVLSADDLNVVTVHNAETGAQVCALPPFELAVSAVAFHPTQPWIIVASVSDRIYVYDHAKQQHTPWSANVGDRIVSHGKAGRPSIILGFAATEKRLFFWGSHFVAAVNLNDSAWEEEDVSSAKRRSSSGGGGGGGGNNSNNSSGGVKERVQRLDGYRDVLHVAVLSDTELVVVERPWKSVLSDLKEQPVYKHRYIL